MTLRFRLVLALVALVTVAQAAFFFATYSLYRNAEYDRLDRQLRNSESVVGEQLDEQAGFDGRHHRPGPGGGPPVVVPPGTWAERIGADGSVLGTIQLSDNSAQPKLPITLPKPA